MSAAELLAQIRQLPPGERNKLLEDLLELEDPADLRNEKQERITWPEPRDRLQRIFGNRPLAQNIVLEAREAEAY